MILRALVALGEVDAALRDVVSDLGDGVASRSLRSAAFSLWP